MKNIPKNQSRNTMLLLMSVWSGLIIFSVVWNYAAHKREILDMMHAQAETAFEKDLLYRRWNARHGGVYVPVTKDTQPNPYLSVESRDVKTESGQLLTMINPAYMTRQVHEIQEETAFIQGHITSLKPIRPENAADPWETKALQAFEKGAKEVSSIEPFHKGSQYRFMRPLKVEESCLKCHVQQGYRLGDLRGGISVSIPMNPWLKILRSSMMPLLVGHIILWGLVSGLIVFLFSRLMRDEQVLRDMTRDAQEVSGQMRRLTRAVEQSPATIVITDRTGKIEYVNPAFTEKTGYSFEEAVGQNPRVLKSGEQPVEFYSKLWDTILSGNVWRGEFHNKKKSGELFWEHASISPIKDEAGNVTHFIAVKEDITERRRYEAALQTESNKNRILLQHGGDGIHILDMNGNVIEANEAFCKMLGYDRSEIIGMNVTRWDGKFEKDDISSIIQGHYSGHTRVEFTTVHCRKDGSLFDVEISGMPVDLDGVPLMFYSSRDITERKMMEDKLQKKSQELIRSNQELEAFAYTISHDLRAPLRTIIGFSQLLLKDKEDQFDSQTIESLKRIMDGGMKMDRMMGEILEYSRIGRKELKTEKVNIKEIISEVLEMLENDIKRKEAVVEFEGEFPELICFKEKIKQVFLNLIGNGLKYIEEGKKPHIKIGCVRKNNREWFFVKDNGIGINKDYHKKIFGIFARLHADSSQYQGSGIGLSTVKKIIDLHEGDIYVESEEGEGATFYFTLKSI